MIKKIKLAMKDLKIQNNQFWISNQLYVSDHKLFWLKILELHHLITITEHSESRKMYQNLLQNYFWLEMKQNCKQYADNCSSCRQFKVHNCYENNEESLYASSSTFTSVRRLWDSITACRHDKIWVWRRWIF